MGLTRHPMIRELIDYLKKQNINPEDHTLVYPS
jgi:hypothetical protein